jgi:two-component system response regulator QseB
MRAATRRSSRRVLKPALPLIILTAREGVANTVPGLEEGADDYIALSVRGAPGPGGGFSSEQPSSEEIVLKVGDAALDFRTRRVTLGLRRVRLTARESALAETLFRHPGQVLSREQLLSHVWGYAYDPAYNVVDVYVGYLRRELDEGRISTVRGIGYRLKVRSQNWAAGPLNRPAHHPPSVT